MRKGYKAYLVVYTILMGIVWSASPRSLIGSMMKTTAAPWESVIVISVGIAVAMVAQSMFGGDDK